MKCVICKHPIEIKTIGSTVWRQGNNAQPVADGRCCDLCDCLVVIPTRMGMELGPSVSFGVSVYKHRIIHQLTQGISITAEYEEEEE